MFDETVHRAPILVLGVGNLLLGDDGAGIQLVTGLSGKSADWGDEVEFLEGGTQGLALLSYLAGRGALILLDAVELGAEPGTLHLFQGEEVLRLGSRSTNAHEGNAGELLRAAQLLGDLPDELALVGIEPGCLETGIGLSQKVQASIPLALQAASRIIESLRKQACGFSELGKNDG